MPYFISNNQYVAYTYQYLLILDYNLAPFTFQLEQQVVALARHDVLETSVVSIGSCSEVCWRLHLDDISSTSWHDYSSTLPVIYSQCRVLQISKRLHLQFLFSLFEQA